jgi:ribonuclease P protein component
MALGRLRKGREFDAVYREGAVVNGPLFVLRWTRSGADAPKWGFAVGKKLLPHAVDRNRLRRRLRAAAATVPVEAGVAVVLTAKRGAPAAPYDALCSALQRAASAASVTVDRR